MRTDIELLELAAKVMGYAYTYRPYGGLITTAGGPKPWDPLTNTDDAFALLMDLKIDLTFDIDDRRIRCSIEDNTFYASEPFGDDMVESTRRAIVRAAAEVGAEL